MSEKPMKQYRKKPVVISASQWFREGDHHRVRAHDKLPSLGWIDTLEGGHIVSPGDWIIRGVEGEFYPCKPDIFAKTYEAVGGETK